MKFYRENEVNPLGSCLPLVAQLPVFISLFYMLRKNLRHDICAPVQARFQAHYASVHHHPCHVEPGSQPDDVVHVLPRALSRGRIPLHQRHHEHGERDHAGRAAGALRRHAGDVDAADVGADDGQEPAQNDADPAAGVRAVHHPLPGRPDRLLDHHQRLDDGPAVHDQALDGAGPPSRRPRSWSRATGGSDDDSAAAASHALFRGRGPRGGGNGDNGSSGGSSAGAPGRVAATPPAPPRKKKKRSGRRR